MAKEPKTKDEYVKRGTTETKLRELNNQEFREEYAHG